MKFAPWQAVVLIAGVLGLVVGVAVAPAASEDETHQIMRAKLRQSQALLEGLANQNFALLKKNAKDMKAVADLEQWIHGENEEYELQLKLFRSANDEIIRQAEEKNIDAAALAFVQLTMSCVNCHKQLRE